MATITNFPVNTTCLHAQPSNKIAPVSAVGNYAVAAQHLTVCKICGHIILNKAESCPKCKNAIYKNAQCAVSTQPLLSYMDTLRAALKNAEVHVPDDYDMALAA